MKRIWNVLWVLPLALATYWFSNFSTHNFHTVLQGQLYRSAQLSGPDLAWVIATYHIRSVINLRGARPEQVWYRQERRVSAQYGVQHYDIALRAHRVPSRKALLQLATQLQTAPKPILVHCWQGADRTGLASAMGVILLENQPAANAKRQVTWYYNVVSPTSVGYQVLQNYFAWLKRQSVRDSKTSFLNWLSESAPLRATRGFYF